MSDVDDLWARIEEARTRLGQVDQAQVRQAEDLSTRLKEIRAGLTRRHDEVERRRAEADRLRHENEQLRRMLHRLLLSIEERYSGRLKTALQEIADQVGALVEVADTERGAEATAEVVVSSGETEDEPSTEAQGPDDPSFEASAEAPPEAGAIAAASAEEDAMEKPDEPEQPGQASALPDEDDSVWLKQIMERARELTAEANRGGDTDSQGSSVGGPASLSRSAVA